MSSMTTLTMASNEVVDLYSGTHGTAVARRRALCQAVAEVGPHLSDIEVLLKVHLGDHAHDLQIVCQLHHQNH